MEREPGRYPVRVAVALVVLVLVTLGPIVAQDTAQPASRYALTAAIVDHHTVSLDRYQGTLGVDHAIYKGEWRSDKAPGQPFIAAPFYALERVFGAEPATHLRESGNLSLWWVTFWSALVPLMVLLVLMIFMCARHQLRYGLVAVVSLGLCTMVLPHSVNLFGHVMCAAFAYGAWFVLDREPVSATRLFAAGALAATAVTIEYEAGIILLVLAGYALVRERGRVLWFVAGTVPLFAFLGWYQARAFGAFWHTPSTYYAGVIGGTSKGGYSTPTLHNLVDIFVGRRGLIIGAPIAIVGIVAAVWLGRTTTGVMRWHAVVGLAVIVPYLILVAGWSGTPILEEPGPRYLIPALPFLAVPVAAMWTRLRSVNFLAAVFGALVAVSATFTFILLGINQSPVRGYAQAIRDGRFVPTLWSMGLGELGVLCYLATVTAAGWFFFDAVRRDRVSSAARELALTR